MASKGLIELVVLNVGLQVSEGACDRPAHSHSLNLCCGCVQVGVINTTVFSIFVLEALVLTFAATPLTLAFYPLHLRKPNSPPSKATAALHRKTTNDDGDDAMSAQRRKYTVVLDRFENMSALLVFSRLVATPPRFTPSSQTTLIASPTGTLTPDADDNDDPESGASFHTLRLVEMTDRTSAVMHAADTDDLLRRDPLMTLYSTFANLNGIWVASSSLAVVEQHLYAETVSSRAERSGSDLILVPWKLAQPGEETTLASYSESHAFVRWPAMSISLT